MSVRSNVDFPLPLPPRMANTSPRGTTKSRCSRTTVSRWPTASRSTSMMGESTAEGIEEHREDGIHDHDGKEAGHDRGRRRPAHALRAAASGESTLAGNEGDAQAE